MSSVRAATPPPRRLRTPQTPRWPGEDFPPYTPRKSTRLSQLSSVTATPRRQTSRDYIDSSSSANTSPANHSTPSSPQTARKRLSRKSIHETDSRRVSGALTRDSTITAASALGLQPPKDETKFTAQQSTSITRRNGMLPTPAKTPKKRPEEITPAVSSVARNLFAIRPAPDEIMPSPKKGRKKYTGLTLDSFEAEEESTPIQIYTDSSDRVPEIDNSPENPFYGKGKSVVAEPRTRSSKRRKIKVDGESDQDIEDLKERKDGMIYVFRGKKTFRKFEPESDSEADEPETSTRRMTRSSIKPRLLFPGADKPLGKDIVKAHTTSDEEADTDIEEHKETLPPAAASKEYGCGTPKAAPKFNLYTPPTTGRATRSKNVDMNGGTADADDNEMTDSLPTSPMLRATSRISKSSPFEEWSRGGPSTRDSKKRATEATSGGPAKKTRQ